MDKAERETLVVVSIIIGRRFPGRKDTRILFEAEFDGECLSTDPVSHSECPEFYQELAWELSKSALHMHRLQRSSIRLSAFAVGAAGGKEAIGFVVLDLRSASNKQLLTWHHLLHCKYKTHRPEIKAGVYIDQCDAAAAVSDLPKQSVAACRPLSPKAVAADKIEPCSNMHLLASPTAASVALSNHFADAKADQSAGPALDRSVRCRSPLISPPVRENNADCCGDAAALLADEQRRRFVVQLHPNSIYIRKMSLKAKIKCRLSYWHELFELAKPALTAVYECEPGATVDLSSSGLYKVQFASSWAAVSRRLTAAPLDVRLWRHGLAGARDDLFAVASVSLSQLLDHSNYAAVVPDAQASAPGFRVLLQFDLLAPHDMRTKRATLSLLASIHDLGLQPPSAALRTDLASADPLHLLSRNLVLADDIHDPTAVRRLLQSMKISDEYKAALELELWKEAQETLFERRLKDKEVEHMKRLGEEWRKREQEREAVVACKLEQYAQMEKHVKELVDDLNQREKTISSKEEQVEMLRRQLVQEQELKLKQMVEASRRLQDEFDHRLGLEKNKVRELEDTVTKCRLQLTQAESAHQQLFDAFEQYKLERQAQPDVQLTAQINMLSLEKQELERRLQSSIKSKLYYKQQLAKSQQQLELVKQQQQQAARQQLQQQQQELEQMRLKFMACDERARTSADRGRLEDIHEQLAHLRTTLDDSALHHRHLQKHREQLKLSERAASTPPIAPVAHSPALPFHSDETVARLIEERDTLLRTGVYTSADRVIAELDRHIRTAIGASRSASEPQHIASFSTAPTALASLT